MIDEAGLQQLRWTPTCACEKGATTVPSFRQGYVLTDSSLTAFYVLVHFFFLTDFIWAFCVLVHSDSFVLVCKIRYFLSSLSALVASWSERASS